MDFEVDRGNVDETQPLIYMWEIRDATGALHGRYVGKARAGAARALKHYARNVAKLLADKPYRKGKPDAFRRVHHALAHGHREGLTITLTLLCNVPADASIDDVEQSYIRDKNCRGSETWQLNG